MITIPYWRLRKEAEKEAYEYFDKNIRRLPRNANGDINQLSSAVHNTDADAFRHAYVSGVFTMVHSARLADLLGRLNEWTRIGPDAEGNMDLWNNQVGRKYGKISKSRKSLANQLKKALENKELIVSPDDSRKYKRNTSTISIDQNKSVIKVENNLG